MARFGYLVPEFPGQTHGFFWRELKALRDMGHEPEPVSTRRPCQPSLPPGWSSGMVPTTHYLTPPTHRMLPGTAAETLRGMALGKLGTVVESLPPARDLATRQQRRHAGSSKHNLRLALRQAGLLWAATELVSHARTRQWEHIHVHSCADAAQIALFAHALSGIPYSLTLHGPLRDYGYNQPKKWQNAAFSTVITQNLLNDVTMALDGHLPAAVRVAPMGVELGMFTRRGTYQAWPGDGPALAFCCARLNPGKGHLELLQAVRQVADAGIDLRLTVAGEDEAGGKGYRAVLERSIHEMGLRGRIRLLGAVTEDRVKEELQKAHLFILASHAEPLGVAIMEAMAMEVPVLTTNSGGVSELVISGENGTLVDPHNPQQLATAIISILRDPDMAIALAIQGRSRIERHFSAQRSASVLAELIESARQGATP